MRFFCERMATTSDAKSACSDNQHVILLQQASLCTLIGGLALIAFIVGAAKSVGQSRAVLATIFNPAVTGSIVLLAVSIFIQGAIALYSLYLISSVFIGYIFPKLFLLIALGAIVASFALAKTAFSFLKKSEHVVLGARVTEQNGAPLLSLIRELAAKVGARAPDNVVVGVEPSFYVTAARIRIASDEQTLQGTTMFVSMPFLELFTLDELSAVIGHELGHFKGDDTAYSVRFYPAYSKLSNALASMHAHADSGLTASMFALPAVSMLSLMLNSFGKVERTIGRGRELEADRVGASAANKEALVSSLLKVSQYGGLWEPLRHHNIEKLSEGQIYGNLPGVYCDLARQTYEELDFDATRSDLFESKMAHPTDTHPTLTERMQSLGIDASAVAKQAIAPAGTPMSNYLTDVEAISEAATVAEHQFMVAIGAAVIPPTKAEKVPVAA